jgi:hypothetical protein
VGERLIVFTDHGEDGRRAGPVTADGMKTTHSDQELPASTTSGTFRSAARRRTTANGGGKLTNRALHHPGNAAGAVQQLSSHVYRP